MKNKTLILAGLIALMIVVASIGLNLSFLVFYKTQQAEKNSKKVVTTMDTLANSVNALRQTVDSLVTVKKTVKSENQEKIASSIAEEKAKVPETIIPQVDHSAGCCQSYYGGYGFSYMPPMPDYNFYDETIITTDTVWMPYFQDSEEWFIAPGDTVPFDNGPDNEEENPREVDYTDPGVI